MLGFSYPVLEFLNHQTLNQDVHYHLCEKFSGDVDELFWDEIVRRNYAFLFVDYYTEQ